MDMSTTTDIGLVHDVHNLDKLRQMSRGDSLEAKKNALLTAASQFESLLNQFWLKEMRSSNEAICPDSPLRSRDSDFFQSMLNEQMVTSIAKSNASNKSSLTRMIVRQFAGSMGDEGKQILAMIEGNNRASNTTGEFGLQINRDAEFKTITSERTSFGILSEQIRDKNNNVSVSDVTNASINEHKFAKKQGINSYVNAMNKSIDSNSDMSFTSPKDFVDKLMPYAKEVAKKFGLNPIVIVGQAALETGWGKHVGAKNNFFGIKASGKWNGGTELMSSYEFKDGIKYSQISSFRCYDSVKQSINDYAEFIVGNKRYEKAVAVSDNPNKYFEEIQKAGYATDPNYADKLKNIIKNDAFSSYL